MTIPLTIWQKPAGELRVAKGRIDLWRFRLDLDQGEMARLTAWLDPSERVRAERLVNENLAGKFIAGRGRLREVLSRYLQQPPAQIDFAYGTYGKPALAGPEGHGLSFNLAHSGAWGLLAVSASAPVGVDLERIDPDLTWQGVALRYFPEPEQADLANLAPARRRRGFYRIWVSREAVMKADGTGFAGARKASGPRCHHVKILPVARGFLGAVASVEEMTCLRRLHLE